MNACRICLSDNVLMFEIEGFLMNCLTQLLGHETLYYTDFPQFVCFECAHLLKKFVKFKEKCRLGQNVLLDLLNNYKQITKGNLLLVDRVNLNLVSNLNISPVPADCYYELQHESDCKEGTTSDGNAHIKSLSNNDDARSSDSEGQFLEEYDVDDYKLSLEDVVPQKLEDEEQDTKHCCVKIEPPQLMDKDDDWDNNYDYFTKASEDCILCRQRKDTHKLTSVRKKGIETMKRFSMLRNDGLLNFLNSVEELKVHIDCRKKYTRHLTNGKYAPLKLNDFFPPVKIVKNNKKPIIQKVKKSKRKPFKPFELPSPPDAMIDYKTHCFVCLKGIQRENKKSYQVRDVYCRVRSLGPIETVLKHLDRLKDCQCPNVNETIKRIQDLDLVAIGAVYHKSCLYKITTVGRKPGEIGRREDKSVKESMNIIYSYMEDMNDGSEFNFEELRGILPDFIPCKRTMKTKLKEHFKDRIIFTRAGNQVTILLRN